jgi:hypothetical protein
MWALRTNQNFRRPAKAILIKRPPIPPAPSCNVDSVSLLPESTSRKPDNPSFDGEFFEFSPDFFHTVICPSV